MEKSLRDTGFAQSDRTIQYATVCSGVEAQSLGCRNLNWHPNFFSEIEPFPCKVLATRYPDVPNLGDLTKMCTKEYSLDVFCGGFPCQSYSVAGKREGGMEGSGTRSSLAYYAIKSSQESLRDGGLFLYENVIGIYSSNEGKDFCWYVHRMIESGFSVVWRTLDTQWICTTTFPRAIPQRRRRMWMICYKGNDWRIPAQILFERTSRLGSIHPNRIVNGHIVRTEDEEQAASLDLFGGLAPTFDSASRADWIPFSAMPGHGTDFLTLSDLSLLDFFRTVGKTCYLGDIFIKGCETTPDAISPDLRANIGNAGCAVGGRIITLKMPEWSAGLQMAPNDIVPKTFDGSVCGLADIVLPWTDELIPYVLSTRTCEGILRRAEMRGHVLPAPLERSICEQIANWSCGVFGDAIAANEEDEEREAEESREAEQNPSLSDDAEESLVSSQGRI